MDSFIEKVSSQLHFNRNAFFVLNLLFDALDRIASFDLERDSFTGERSYPPFLVGLDYISK